MNSIIRARLAELGPYFAADSHDGATEPDAPWRSMGEMLDDPGITEARVEGVRRYLAGVNGLPVAAVEARVAASVMHLGLVARTLSPLFAVFVLGGALPSPSLRDLRWQPAIGSMFALSIAGLDGPDCSMQTRAPMSIEPIAAELSGIMRPFGVSPLILRGNLASALNGARIALSAADPGLASAARTELTRLLTTEPLLAETGRMSGDGRFRRRSCCLIYRAAPDRKGALCGDCVLRDARR